MGWKDLQRGDSDTTGWPGHTQGHLEEAMPACLTERDRGACDAQQFVLGPASTNKKHLFPQGKSGICKSGTQGAFTVCKDVGKA